MGRRKYSYIFIYRRRVLKVTTLDIETTFKKDEDGKVAADPYTGNMLVSVGYKTEGVDEYLCFSHTKKETTENGFGKLQKVLDNTELLVGHNIKFDLKWLLACNFKYTGKLWDTMIAEYVIHGGDKVSLSLEQCVKRYDLDEKRTDLTEQYLKDGVSFDRMPWNIVEEYGRADVEITEQLFLEQQKNVTTLAPTIEMMNDMCRVLIEMENS